MTYYRYLYHINDNRLFCTTANMLPFDNYSKDAYTSKDYIFGTINESKVEALLGIMEYINKCKEDDLL